MIEMVGLPQFFEESDRLAQRCGKRFAPIAKLRVMAETGKGFDWS